MFDKEQEIQQYRQTLEQIKESIKKINMQVQEGMITEKVAFEKKENLQSLQASVYESIRLLKGQVKKDNPVSLNVTYHQNGTEIADYLYHHMVDDEGIQNNKGILTKITNQIIKILENELTDRQREVVIKRLNNVPISTIAEEMGVYPSTASRHYYNGMKQIKRFAQYLQPFLRQGGD